jgi:hypothetical protein
VSDWWEHGQERYFVLGGGVGVGKTAALQEFVRDHHSVAAAHFCRPDDAASRHPETAARELAMQLSRNVGGFAAALVEGAAGADVVVSGMASAEVVEAGGISAGVIINTLQIQSGSDIGSWMRLVRTPLDRLARTNGLNPLLIVVDALDEADRYEGTTLTELIVDSANSGSVRWLVSSRYPDALIRHLPAQSFQQWNLSEEQGKVETEQDVEAFLQSGLRRLAISHGSPAPDSAAELARDAAARSNGNFLHANLLIAALERLDHTPTADDIDKVPNGLDGILDGYLRTIVTGDRGLTWINGYFPVLSALSAIREPVTQAQLQRLSGVASSVATRVLSQLQPLLRRRASPTAAEVEYSLYHAEFSDFLAGQDRAGEWWCDQAEAHERIVASYESATGGWRHWHDLDGYGIRNLFNHARQAGWHAAQFDSIVVPDYLAVMARKPGNLVDAIQRLTVPLQVAFQEADVLRTFLWGWTAHILHHSLRELVSSPVLLVKSGRLDLAMTALAVADIRTAEMRSFRGQLVATLASQAELESAQAIIALAPSEQRAELLVRCAIETAPVNAESAWQMIERAQELAASQTGNLPDVAEAAVVFAGVPGQADRAWSLAAGRRLVQEKVATRLARLDPPRAVAIAREHRYTDALAAACVALADTEPEQAHELLRECARTRSDWGVTAYAVAAKTGLSGFPLAEAEELSPALQALILAAASSAVPDGEALARLAEATERSLHRKESWLIAAFEDVSLLSRLDPAPLLSSDKAGRLAACAVADVIRAKVQREPSELGVRAEDSTALGQLCGTVFILDRALGETVRRQVRGERRIDSISFDKALVARICPIDMEAAWSAADEADWHSVRLAWAESLPPALLADAIELAASISEEYSATRAAVAEQLAMKLSPGNQAMADRLLQLISPPSRSAIFLTQAETASAAFTDRDDLVSPPGSPTAYVTARRRNDLAGELYFQLAQHGKFHGSYPARDLNLRTAAAAFARDTGQSAAAILANTAALLMEKKTTPDSALTLLSECLHPTYRPRSAYATDFLRCEYAIARAYAVWQRSAEDPASSFVGELISLAVGRGQEEELPMLTSLLGQLDEPTWRHVLQQTTHYPRIFTSLAEITDARYGPKVPTEWEPCLDDLASKLNRQSSLLAICILNVLARRWPTETLSLVECPAMPNFSHWLDMVKDTVLRELLTSIAVIDTPRAVAGGEELCRQRPDYAGGRDVLHAVAVAVSYQDWAAGFEIARSIDFENVRGPALADMAASASRLADPAARVAAYQAILDEADRPRIQPASQGYLTRSYRESIRQGLLAVIQCEAEPPPEIVARLTRDVLEIDPVRATYHQGEFADLLGILMACVDHDTGYRVIKTAERLVGSVWKM